MNKVPDKPIRIYKGISPDSVIIEPWARDYVKSVLIDKGLLEKRIEKLASVISAHYGLATEEYRNAVKKDKKERLVLVTVLEGALTFSWQLACKLEGKIEQTSLKISSRRKTESIKVSRIHGLKYNLRNRNVLVVEDIVDTGKTLEKIIDTLDQRGAKDIKIVSLLDKPWQREKNIKIDFTGFIIPDLFVVGYGLDYDGSFRNLQYIAVLKSYD